MEETVKDKIHDVVGRIVDQIVDGTIKIGNDFTVKNYIDYIDYCMEGMEYE